MELLAEERHPTNQFHGKNGTNEDDEPDHLKIFLIRAAIGVGIALTIFLLFKMSSYFTQKYFARKQLQLQTILPPNHPHSNHQVYTVDSNSMNAYGYTDSPPVYNDALKCKGKDSKCEGLPPSYYDAVTPT